MGTKASGSPDVMRVDPVLAEIVRRLAEAYRPWRIYLFGSHALGNTNPDSDYDVFVVVPDDAPPEQTRSQLGYQALRGTGVATDVLVATRRSFERRLHLPASLPAVVSREGRVVYGT